MNLSETVTYIHTLIHKGARSTCHERRLTCLGPGGRSKESATLATRAIRNFLLTLGLTSMPLPYMLLCPDQSRNNDFEPAFLNDFWTTDLYFQKFFLE
jgi:hypothetical protein